MAEQASAVGCTTWMRGIIDGEQPFAVHRDRVDDPAFSADRTEARGVILDWRR